MAELDDTKLPLIGELHYLNGYYRYCNWRLKCANSAGDRDHWRIQKASTAGDISRLQRLMKAYRPEAFRDELDHVPGWSQVPPG